MWWFAAFPTIRTDTPVVPHVLPGVWFRISRLAYGYGGVIYVRTHCVRKLLYNPEANPEAS